jgi:hypothetical protein
LLAVIEDDPVAVFEVPIAIEFEPPELFKYPMAIDLQFEELLHSPIETEESPFSAFLHPRAILLHLQVQLP